MMSHNKYKDVFAQITVPHCPLSRLTWTTGNSRRSATPSSAWSPRNFLMTMPMTGLSRRWSRRWTRWAWPSAVCWTGYIRHSSRPTNKVCHRCCYFVCFLCVFLGQHNLIPWMTNPYQAILDPKFLSFKLLKMYKVNLGIFL